ncbi:capsular polysaccharide biosynthesis protein [Parathalassolituus penaei]|uniref:Capsular polysaccharide biosynthesis protein n=1 Tax=Parathalassolituus penaei TaxID=2997323 RepID=A0A9X3IU78_9GAMM|nr:capsular polysaccharide biosynthesis protein [Parathalassolituus penaei]MCY0966684.1 capsular polysaccharide biosynthesis protein [Parathalassolituus penaei]
MSAPLVSQPAVRSLFPAADVKLRASRADVYVGWGRKGSGDRARQKAASHSRPYLLLEDGFLRSAARDDDSVSVVIDNAGIFYDASVPSRLEMLIQQPLSVAERARCQLLIRRWCELRLSKYNSAPEYHGQISQPYVLVLDQVAGDASVGSGLATPASFQEMLTAALRENPDCTVVVKVHPDAYTRGKAGHFDVHQLQDNPRIRVVAENCHLVGLLEAARAVYTVTSQVGFEALLWGKPVRCFGMPFYAGWGLTRDSLPAPERRCSVELDQLVFAALVRYSAYVDPVSGQACSLEQAMDYIALQRCLQLRFQHLQPLAAVAFSRWKKPFVKRFLAGHELRFVPTLQEVPSGCTPVLWGNNDDGKVTDPHLRIEDGFLRSSGLGADLIAPMSWVIEEQGMYYDARTPSALETILATHEFDDELIRRTVSLKQRIIAAGVSKYNLGGQRWQRPDTDKQVVLVPGQVENDASLRFGGCGIVTNLGLLKAVRSMRPDAWIIYKPHPDVVTGLRKGMIAAEDLVGLADEVVTDVDSMLMLPLVDEVHTMTSLLGFEALLRGRTVVCYGHPFYAGWGLTADHTPIPRRQRRLKVDELIAAALILYPVYVSRRTGRYCSVEQALEELIVWKQQGPSRMPFWRRCLRVVLRAWVSLGIRKNA